MLWTEAVDFTFQDRPKWKGKEHKQPGIACRHFTEFAGNIECSTIKRPLLKQYGIWLEDTRELKDATINRHFAAVSTVLRHCIQEEMLDMSLPVVPRREEYEGRPFFFTKEQVNQMCSIRSRHGLSDLVRFASLTGARSGECLSLKVHDIDLDEGIIYIGGRPDFKTKSGDWRTVPIHTQLIPILKRRVEGIPDDICVFGDEWNSGDHVLTHFKKLTREIGLSDQYVFHCLRHSFATWHVEAGTPIRVIMELMGHSLINTTLRYAKVTDSARTKAIASI